MEGRLGVQSPAGRNAQTSRGKMTRGVTAATHPRPLPGGEPRNIEHRTSNVHSTLNLNLELPTTHNQQPTTHKLHAFQIRNYFAFDPDRDHRRGARATPGPGRAAVRGSGCGRGNRG